ncbi:two-component regulator propeller domain-containing protein [Lunatimonas salinarum]|uniref:type IX secretion system anionic LPS delivery protein PorZ n=1 Tax=Lunatimonas salinarum TaxID=1774590 RepID=UPI001ADF7B8D|nr:two-component regulator propeller domain-containing protein [Lunatimonas salinarum]
MRQGAGNAFLRTCNRVVIACLSALLGLSPAWCQENIAVGSWRSHGNYTQISQLAGAAGTVFALAESSLFFFSDATPVPTPLGKADGLHAQSFSRMAYEPQSKTLVVAYADGTLELIAETRIQRINDLKNNPLILRKQVNQLFITGDTVWIAGDFGVASLSIKEAFIQRAFLNIGSSLPVLDIAVIDTGIYLLTENGLYYGDQRTNLNDFNQWQSVSLPGLSVIRELHVSDGVLFLVGADRQLYQLTGQIAEWVVGASDITGVKVTEKGLVFHMDNLFYKLNLATGIQPTEFRTDDTFTDFLLFDNALFLATPGKGLLKMPEGRTLSPNGIRTNQPIFYSSGREMIAYEPSSDVLDAFIEGRWHAIETEEILTSVSNARETLYLGTLKGLFQWSSGELTQITHPLLPQNRPIEALASSRRGSLYALVKGPQSNLTILDPSGQTITQQIPGIDAPKKLLIDRSENLWILEHSTTGRNLRVVNKENGLDRTLGNTLNQGGLPANTVQDIFLDQEDNLWVATTQGLGYIFNAASIDQNTGLNAVLPIFQNRQVLANTSISQLIVAPDRSIWAGTTNQGLWHFSENFTELLHHFTPENSLLPSSGIYSMALNQLSGELFIGTDRGAVSFRSGAMQASERLESLKIYPNPVHASFGGLLSIEGLTDFATLKISHSSGRMVASMQAAGGKVTWNLRLSDGTRISAGVYLVYVVDESGKERLAGKFLIM